MPFTPAALDFLVENRLQNSRTWYQEHKDRFRRDVYAPFVELVEALTPTMLSIDPQLIVEPRTDRTISRVYRDTRFSRDKSLYREVMWCVFQRNKKLYHGLPGFFFEISPDRLRWGCGYYAADRSAMEAMREMILQKDALFCEMLRAYRAQDRFALENERYKRTRFPEQPEELRAFLDLKSLCFLHESRDFPLLFSDRLAEVLADDFLILAPMYRFMLKMESRRPHDSL